MKKKTIALLGLGTVIVSTAYYKMCSYLYDHALKGHQPPFKTSDTTDYGPLNKLREKGKEFASQNPPRCVTIKSHDELILAGYTFEQESDKWVIIVHGYQGKASSMFYQAMKFYEKGFNVLTIDCRGHGKSEGDAIGMGWLDRLDVLEWIDFILDLSPQAKIVLYGVSMGGVTVMMTTGEDLPKQVVCAIEDCGYSDAYTIFYEQIKKTYHMSPALFLNGTSVIAKQKAGYYLQDVDSLKQLRKSKTPTLFIHGQEDAFVPFKMVYDCYEACSASKEIMTPSHVGHALAMTKPYYFLKLFEFVDRYI